MVTVEVLTEGRHGTTVAGTAAAKVGLLPFHAPHVGGGTTEIGQHTVKIGILSDKVHFIKYRCLTAASYLFPLVGTDSAEGTAAETSAVGIHAPAYHFKGWYRSTLLVLGMRQSQVGQIERSIHLVGGHRRLWRIYHHISVAMLLHQRRTLYLVAFSFNHLIVLRLTALAFLTLLERMEFNRIIPNTLDIPRNPHHLGQFIAGLDALALVEHLGNLERRSLTHAIVQQVGRSIYQYRGEKFVVPVVVVCQATHRSLDASNNDRHIGINLLKDARIDISGAVGSESSLTTRGVGVIVAQTPCGSVMVHHAVHGTTSNAEKESRTSELSKITQVVSPVGLRNNGHLVPCCLKRAPDNSRAKRRMVNIGIACDQHHVNLLPTETLDLLQCYGQKMSHIQKKPHFR